MTRVCRVLRVDINKFSQTHTPSIPYVADVRSFSYIASRHQPPGATTRCRRLRCIPAAPSKPPLPSNASAAIKRRRQLSVPCPRHRQMQSLLLLPHHLLAKVHRLVH